MRTQMLLYAIEQRDMQERALSLPSLILKTRFGFKFLMMTAEMKRKLLPTRSVRGARGGGAHILLLRERRLTYYQIYYHSKDHKVKHQE
jgi:hypothetical protein